MYHSEEVARILRRYVFPDWVRPVIYTAPVYTVKRAGERALVGLRFYTMVGPRMQDITDAVATVLDRDYSTTLRCMDAGSGDEGGTEAVRALSRALFGARHNKFEHNTL